MFSSIVSELNKSIVPAASMNHSDTQTDGAEDASTTQLNIGLLDIYGFEVFKENGFE